MKDALPRHEGQQETAAPRDEYRQKVASLALEAWSPTRIAGEYGLARRHARTGEERYAEYKPLADERLFALEELESATGTSRITIENAAEFQRRKRAGMVTPDELAVENARQDYETAAIVAMSARNRADSAAERAQLIHDAYPGVVHGVLGAEQVQTAATIGGTEQ